MKIVNTYIATVPTFTTEGKMDADPALTVMAVLTMDNAGLYAAYIGLVPCKNGELVADKDRMAWAVAGLGRKLRHDYVAMYFPDIRKEQYRA